MQKYDTVVFIGRFQPFHNAHLETIRRASAYSNTITIILGSDNQPRTFKNPWSTKERAQMIVSAVRAEKIRCDLNIIPVEDNMYNDQAWAINIQEAVAKVTEGISDSKIAIIGHDKDESTFYLNMFPQWDKISVDLIEPLNATHIRDLYFVNNANLNFIKNVLPETTFEYLGDFMDTEEYNQIIREKTFIEDYKKQFSTLPYAPTFVTVDAVVVQSGHILMIRRRSEPGKGLWALPGGFLNAATDKSMQDAMIRELREETGIKVPSPVLVGNVQKNRVFDAIGRSSRGRTITHAFKIVLPDGELPKVKGQDDADKAKWIPISKIRRDQCFEDHHDIIQWAVGN